MTEASEKRHMRILKKWVRMSLLAIIILIILSSLNLIKYSHIKAKKVPIEYFYNIKQNVDYKTYLHENSFVEQEYLTKDDMLMADLIKNININLNYSYSGSKITPIRYDYNIVGSINGKYKLTEDGDSQLWSKEYQLLEKKEGMIQETTGLSLNEELNIDYAYYDKIVSDFRKELKISIDATFDVVMTVNVYGTENYENKLADTKTMVVSIPLNKQVFKITSAYEPTTKNNITTSEQEKARIDTKKFVCGILLFLIGVAMFIELFNKIFNIKKKTPYNIKLTKILKDYGDIIVEVVSQTVQEGLNVVEVKNFNEMIDLEEELRIPIMFYEIEEDVKGEFTLIHNGLMYIYVLNNEN